MPANIRWKYWSYLVALIGVAGAVVLLMSRHNGEKPVQGEAAVGMARMASQSGTGSAGLSAEELAEAVAEAERVAEELESADRRRGGDVPRAGTAVPQGAPGLAAPPLTVVDRMSDRERQSLTRRGVLCNSTRSLAALRSDPAVILLQNAIIDTTVIANGGRSVDIPVGLRASEDSERFIVLFREALSEDQKRDLVAAGATVEHYVPNRAYAVTADAEAMAQIRAMDDVAYVEPFHPYFKTDPDVQAYLAGTADAAALARVEKGEYSALLFSGSDARTAIEDLGATVSVRRVGRLEIATVVCPPELLAEVVQVDGLKWVETQPELKVMNDVGNKTLRASAAKFSHANLDGSGVIVGIADTGVDFTHRGFAINPALPTSTNLNTRIVHYAYRTGSTTSDGIPGDTEAHGTHTSGSVLGNGALSTNVVSCPGSLAPYTTNQFAGVAPGAKLVMVEDFNSFTDTEIAEAIYTHGGRVSSHSWGAESYTYSTLAMAWDELVRDSDSVTAGDQQLITFFSAGNSGDGESDGSAGVAGTIGSPGLAKNVITVGAVEQRRLANNLPDYNSLVDTDTDWQVADFSSRGPTLDGRRKPDIMAPGHFIISAQSKDVDMDSLRFPDQTFPTRDYSHGNVNTGPRYGLMSGTSMACPLAAGAGALLYQYYTNAFDVPPTPAMVKAMMVNGAKPLHSVTYAYDQYPTTVDEGWGMVDVAESLTGPNVRSTDTVSFFDEEDNGTVGATGETVSRSYTVAESGIGGLKITLVWTDEPGTAGTGAALVNDLDLIVTAPDGTIYVGNYMGRIGWGTASYGVTSYTTNMTDHLNNVENVVIRHTQAGIYTIDVHGYQLPTPPQNFALVVSQGVGSLGDFGAASSALALDADGYPVMVGNSRSGYQVETELIQVRRWVGAYGAGSDFGTWRQLRDNWFDYGTTPLASVINGSVLGSVVSEPSVAVNTNNGNVYVAWLYQSYDETYPDCVYLRYWNGTAWGDLGGSYRDYGICDDGITKDASSPIVGVAWDGQPMVAYIQKRVSLDPVGIYKEAVIKKWNGSAWVSLDGSTHGRVLEGKYVSSLDMVTDNNGYPVLLWRNLTPLQLECYWWTGAPSWRTVATTIAEDTVASRGRAKLAVHLNDIYVTYVALPEMGKPKYTARVLASTYTGSAWTSLGGSQSYPGVSGTNGSPYNPQIAYANDALFVAWQSEATNENKVLLKKWDGSAWSSVGGSSTTGVAHLNGEQTLQDLVVNAQGHPAFSVSSTRQDPELRTVDTAVFGYVKAVEAPSFLGVKSATGTASNTVALTWLPTHDPAQTLTYRIYQTPGTGWSSSDLTRPEADDAATIAAVFSNEIASVQDLGSYVVTGLPAGRVWFFGVRVENESGVQDVNTKILPSGPYDLLGDADGDWLSAAEEIQIGTDPSVRDSDGDGMWDGWEWFYSTSNSGQFASIPPHTNALAMGPHDGTTVGYGPYDDLDGDDLLNIEEFRYWTNSSWVVDFTTIDRTDVTNWWLDPTSADTDGDGMPDGWEFINGLNPVDASDAASDPDWDGLTNLQEFENNVSPNFADSDHDGISDGDEINTWHTDPLLGDTDGDGLQDGYEASVGGNPLVADTDGDGMADGAEYQAGYASVSNGLNVNLLLHETFENAASVATNVTFYSPAKQMWHRSTADPSPPSAAVSYIGNHTTSHVIRCADDPTGADLAATYDTQGELVYCAMDTRNVSLAGITNLYVSWNELYETEAQWDLCQLLASTDNGNNWLLVRDAVSGVSTGWLQRTASLNAFVGNTQLKVRFLFRTLNAANNAYRGWFVDDIRIYGATRIRGTVRDVSGQPIKGVTVFALGRGGVTNTVHGHRYVLPGQVFASKATAEDGSYQLDAVPWGQYYVKASYSGYRAEFWNGVLYTNEPYYTAFGKVINPGVFERGLVTAPPVTMSMSNLVQRCDFELEAGSSRGTLAVMTDTGHYGVFVDQVVEGAQVWNGWTNAGQRALIDYQTTNTFVPSDPDWITANRDLHGVRPSVIGGVAAGLHTVYLHPGWADAPRIPSASFPVRDGELTEVIIGTNQAAGQIYVKCEAGRFPIYLDERDTGEVTSGTKEYSVVLPVLAGPHEVALRPVGTNIWVTPTGVTVSASSRTFVSFSNTNLFGAKGALGVRTVDLYGNAVTGATVRLDGQLVTASHVVESVTTPLAVTNVSVGEHWISVSKAGYKLSARRVGTVYAGQTNTVAVTLYESDEDYDLVGDYTERVGYGNVFLFARDDDPDADGVDNLTEYEQFRLNNVRMNIFDADSDDDGMLDGDELGYDGLTNALGYSVLHSKAAIGSRAVEVQFRGRFLDGLNAFNTNLLTTGADGLRVSIEGDMFHATNVTWTGDSFDSPVLVFGVPGSGVRADIVSLGHDLRAAVYIDTFPDTKDTEGDGMWDGFESLYSSVGLNPIATGPTEEDPDNDNLVNLDEFLGFDGVANTNDWLDPGDADTDDDFMPDGWEIENELDPRTNNASLDPDGDGLSNQGEWQAATDPHNTDSDQDFLSDGMEVHDYGSDPTLYDTDSDGLYDGEEVRDTDMDETTGLDGGFFPNWAGGDLDGDGFVDGPTDWDTDGDGMPDGFEVKNNRGELRSPALDPYDPSDAAPDFDGDGLSNLDEYLVRDALVGNHPSVYDSGYAGVIWDYSTDPFDADTDGDGLPDGYEVYRGLHPVDPLVVTDEGDGISDVLREYDLYLYGDMDNDGVANVAEYRIRFIQDPGADSNVLEGSTHPWIADTDGDGLLDGEETKAFGSNPLTQDTDGDGIMDGVAVEDREGEIDSSYDASATNHYDQALSDFWQLVIPPKTVYTYPIWLQVHGNGEATAPSARWGMAGAMSGYVVKDSKIGEYVGKYGEGGSGAGAGEQTLLVNEKYMMFGGQNGVRHFDEVWQFDRSNGWELTGLNCEASGDSGLAAATKLYVVDTYDAEKRPFARPRPGAPVDDPPAVGFKYYDGTRRDDDPLQIWGTNGLPNRDITVTFGGWWSQERTYGWVTNVDMTTTPWTTSYNFTIVVDTNSDPSYAYNGGYVHDYVEERSHTYLAYSGQYFKSGDYSNVVVTYTWSVGSDAYEWSDTTGVASNDQGTIRIGAVGDRIAYAGISIADVLNTTNDVGGSVSWEAHLLVDLRYDPTYLNGSPVLNVKLIGELDAKNVPSLPSDDDHLTLTSPLEYYTDRDIQDPADRPRKRDLGLVDPDPYASSWAFNTASSVTVPVTDTAGVYVRKEIDVTALVDEMLNQTTKGQANWEIGNNMGFLFIGDTNSPGVAAIKEGTAQLRIRVMGPPYLEKSKWVFPDPPTMVVHPHERKSTAISWSESIGRFVLFGGVDSVRALDDTWTTVDQISGWTKEGPETVPPARWGHSMCEAGEGVVMFGGFGADGKAMDDMWYYDGDDWQEVVSDRNPEILMDDDGFAIAPPQWEWPRPRAGAALGLSSGYIVLFGGTDGETYFNDTWAANFQGVVETNAATNAVGSVATNYAAPVIEWLNINPMGESAGGPSPRAFMSYNNNDCGFGLVMFGGRSGTLPTGSDTDGDWVDDGLEVELGGPAAGRDPRVNALIAGSGDLNPYVETIPYVYKRLGGIPAAGLRDRNAVLDFESLQHYMDYHAGWFVTDFPAEGHSPYTSGYEGIGYDSAIPEQTDLWWHRHGIGDALDDRDEWELGGPEDGGLAENAAPPTAHSGKWCYGTDLNGTYADEATMELYSPLFSLELPASDSTDPSNLNGFYLVFHEWLDLADSGDSVQVEAVRPSTPADVVNRKNESGLKPPLTILPARNNAYNTDGEWRRVVVPLDPVANETMLYFRFVLQSDGSGHAGGWYIDDLAICQGGQISGTYTNPGTVYLFAADGTNALDSTSTGPNADFGFEFLPGGQYNIVADTGASDLSQVGAGNGTWAVTFASLVQNEIVLGITVNSPAKIMWNSVPGVSYEVQYTTPSLITGENAWTALDTVRATSESCCYIDYGSEEDDSRLYRVVLLGVLD